jgi:hypothetical protein
MMSTEKDRCWECARGEAWEQKGRATKQEQIADLARRASQLRTEIRAIEALIDRADIEVATHNASCAESRA